MQISILTLGTRGDVQPFIALGIGLKNKGHNVRIIAPKSFKELVEKNDIEFCPVSSDYKELLDSKEGKNLLKYYPASLLFNFKKVILPFMYKGFDNYWQYAKDSDLIIYHPKVLVAPDIAQKLNIPYIIGGTIPMLSKTGEFMNPALKVFIDTPKWLNRLSYSINSLMQIPFKGIINNWRKTRLDLPKRDSFKSITKVSGKTIPVIYACSSLVVPRPKDWDDNTIMSGYWFLDEASGFKPSEEIYNFLNSGKPPICFTFSSLPIKNPEKLIAIILGALKDTNQRGIIVSGWTDLKIDNIPENILITGPIPYGWLFPKVAFVVCHGGAGTTVEAIRAQKPMVIYPYNVDQPFWAKQCCRLGICPKPIFFNRLEPRNLGIAIEEVIKNESYSKKAIELGEKINSEDGVKASIEFIEKLIA